MIFYISMAIFTFVLVREIKELKGSSVAAYILAGIFWPIVLGCIVATMHDNAKGDK